MSSTQSIIITLKKMMNNLYTKNVNTIHFLYVHAGSPYSSYFGTTATKFCSKIYSNMNDSVFTNLSIYKPIFFDNLYLYLHAVFFCCSAKYLFDKKISSALTHLL